MPDGNRPDEWPSSSPLSRRALLKGIAGGGAAAALAGLAAACGSTTPAATAQSTPSTPRRGGVLRVGLTGGSSSDTLDPDNTITNPDFARAFSLFNSLVELDLDAQPRLSLAEEVTPNRSATEWTIRVRSGVTFHNGKGLTAEDVIATLRRIADPKSPLEGASQIAALDLKDVSKLDSRTFRVRCHTPYSILPETLAGNFFFVTPTGFDPKHPVGTGPFKFGTFSPGVQSTFPRFPDYWQDGLPYADSLVLTEYADETSQVNALLGDQEDIVAQLSTASIAAVTGQGKHSLVSGGEGWNPFTMRVDVPPFNNPRVREAMRLIVDRQQMLDVVFAGHGTIGNDVFAPFDATYDRALPQRHQDIPRAKALLRAAGTEDLSVQLVTAPIAQGVVSSAQVFAQQARAAGVRVTLHEVTSTGFFGPNYLKWPFAQDDWVYTPYLVQVSQATLPSSPFNECHFDDLHYNALYAEAIATTDAITQTELVHEMQLIDYSSGGYIIPYFPPVIDAYAPHVQGLLPSRTGLPLSNYGFGSMWLT